MSIKYLKIKNYRSIKECELELSSGINIFVGASDSGKSNIIRSIRDLVFNCRGNDFVTFGEDHSFVRVNDVIWQKGKGLNKYKCSKGDFINVGSDSPMEVKDELKIKEIDFKDGNKKKINFIEQFEQKFFVSTNESTNARVLGNISGIDRIYSGNKKFLSDLKSKRNFLNTYKRVLANLNEELKIFDINKLKQIKKYFKSISILQKKANEKKQLIQGLESLRDEYNSNCKKIKKYSILKELDLVIDNKNLSTLEKLNIKIQNLNEIFNKKIKMKKRKNELNNILELEMSKLKKLNSKFEEHIKKSNICPLTKSTLFDSCKNEIMKL